MNFFTKHIPVSWKNNRIHQDKPTKRVKTTYEIRNEPVEKTSSESSDYGQLSLRDFWIDLNDLRISLIQVLELFCIIVSTLMVSQVLYLLWFEMT